MALGLAALVSAGMAFLFFQGSNNKTCQIINDTGYKVMIVEYDGTNNLLNPGQKANTTCTEWNLSPYRPNLILRFPNREEVTLQFSASEFDPTRHKISELFGKEIEDYEEKQQILEKVEVTHIYSKWNLIFTHPGKYTMKQKVEMSQKSFWSRTIENEAGFEAAVGIGVIRIIEASAKFKSSTTLTAIHQREESIIETREFEFGLKPCYIWREMVIVETNQKSPFDRLEISTIHIFATDDGKEPGKDLFVYTKIIEEKES